MEEITINLTLAESIGVEVVINAYNEMQTKLNEIQTKLDKMQKEIAERYNLPEGYKIASINGAVLNLVPKSDDGD